MPLKIKLLWPKWADPPRLLLFITGVSALISAIARVNWLQYELTDILPGRTSKLLLALTGFILIFLSQQVALRKRNAWYASIVLLTCLIGFSMLHAVHALQLVLYASVLGYLIACRDEYVVRSDYESARRMAHVFMMQLAVIFLFFVITIGVIDQKDFGRELTTSQTLSITARALSGEELPAYVKPTKRDVFLIDILRLSIVAGGLLFLWNLFRPIAIEPVSRRRDRERAERILSRHSDSPEDFFKLYPHDKHYFFFGESFIAYSVKNGVALILDGPSGKTSMLGLLRSKFMEYCRINGWQTATIHCDQAESELWEKRGQQSILIGNEAVVDIEKFFDKTHRNKHFRYVKNKAEKSALTTEVWKTPLSPEKIQALRSISDEWQAAGRKEYSFIMAPFDDSYIRNSETIVLLEDNRPVAYCNLVPQFQTEYSSIDHMRHTAGLPNVAMHYLLLSTIEQVQKNNYKYFNLGLSPLAKIEEQAESYTEKTLVLIKKYAGSFYSFSGLEQFKNKFEPDWRSRYITHEKGPVNIAKVFQALNSATTVKQTESAIQKWIIGLAIVSAVSYASFPLAFVLTPAQSLNGLVSALGQEGQAYAWVYNALDVLSSITLDAAVILACIVLRPKDSWKLASIALGVSALGAFAAALIPLPPWFKETAHIGLYVLHEPLVLMHGIASFVNTIGFVVAIVIWTKHFWQLSRLRAYFGIATLLVGIGGLVIGSIITKTEPYAQRLFISMYAVWLVLFFFDFVKYKRMKFIG